VTASVPRPSQASDHKELALRSIRIMQDDSREEFDEVLHPRFLNHEAGDEPPEARRGGPAAAYATALWLRDAYAELRWDVHEVVAEGDLVAVHCTMSGRHVRTFVGYDEQARVKEAFPPTGKRFASTQTHWLRIADGQVIEHSANRDDLGMALQLGWVPPHPRTSYARCWPSAARARRIRTAETGPGGAALRRRQAEGPVTTVSDSGTPSWLSAAAEWSGFQL
jgi:predicted ester cyclase